MFCIRRKIVSSIKANSFHLLEKMIFFPLEGFVFLEQQNTLIFSPKWWVGKNYKELNKVYFECGDKETLTFLAWLNDYFICPLFMRFKIILLTLHRCVDFIRLALYRPFNPPLKQYSLSVTVARQGCRLDMSLLSWKFWQETRQLHHDKCDRGTHEVQLTRLESQRRISRIAVLCLTGSYRLVRPLVKFSGILHASQ